MNTSLQAKTDYELVTLYENGNDKAFDILLHRHQKYIFSYILFLVKDEDTANDFFQETFIRAVTAIRSHRYQTTGKFSAWLIRIAHNLILDNRRCMSICSPTGTEAIDGTLLNDIHHSEEAFDTSIIRTQDNEQLQQLLGYLPRVQREIVILRFFEDLSFKEIAQQTGVSINTALGRMRYALINLRKIMQQHQFSLVG